MWRSSTIALDLGAAVRYLCSIPSSQMQLSRRSQEILAILTSPDWNRGLQGQSLPDAVVHEVLGCITDWRTVMEFYRWAGSRPDYSHCFRNLRRTLSTLCRANRHQEAYQMLLEAAKSGPAPDSFLYSLVMLKLSNAGQTLQVLELLRKMRSASVVPETRLLNLTLKNLKADDGLWVVRQFPDVVTCVSCSIVMDKLSKQGRIDEARELLLEMEARGIKGDAYTYTSLIHGYCRLGKLDEACQVLESMTCYPCSATYNTIIKSLCDVRRFTEAFALMDDMAEKGCIPTVVTFGTLVDGLCKANRLPEAMELLEVMTERGCFPNALVFNSIVDGLCKEGRSTEARALIDTMTRMRVFPTCVTYNILINGCCKEDKLDKAFEMLQEMVEKGYKPNSVTYNTFLHGLCKHGRVDEALKLVCEMKDSSMPLDTYGYTTLIDGLCQAGKVAEAFSMLEEMESSNFCVTSSGCYKSLLSCLCKSNRTDEAHKLFLRMTGSGVLPDWVTFGTMIFGYCQGHRIDDALLLFRQMTSAGLAPTVFTYNTLINALKRGGRVVEACKLLQEMTLKGLSPDHRTSTLLRNKLDGDKNLVQERL